ncbi:MAG: bifunctional 5,10-methylenetetrahydrofolate dehydrogenase/5,10-methenyltetrahydrofolate cyclohydrolase [Parcubacteria group bacterium]
MIILDGKKLSETILEKLKKEIKNRRLKLKLVVVLVGKDRASRIYVKKKELACKKIGVGFELYRFNSGIKDNQLEKKVKKMAEDSENSGIVIQLPLPRKMNSEKVLNIIPGKKDVDVLSKNSFEKFAKSKLSILPPTVAAVFYFFNNYGIKLKEKYVVIVGAGRLVGKPLAAWLRLQKVNFSILDKNTEDLSYFTQKADILITGVGKPDLIKGDMVKIGAIVIDVGGDVDFKSVSKKAAYITPTIGGVGPMTVACLLENLVKLNSK